MVCRLVAIVGSVYWTRSFGQVTSTHLRIGHPEISSTGMQSSKVLQWFHLKIGHQDSSPSTGHQSDMPYSLTHLLIEEVDSAVVSHILVHHWPAMDTDLWFTMIRQRKGGLLIPSVPFLPISLCSRPLLFPSSSPSPLLLPAFRGANMES